MTIVFTEDDLKEESKGMPFEDVTLKDIKTHKAQASLPAENVYFQRDGSCRSLKSRETPRSSLILSALLLRSEAIN